MSTSGQLWRALSIGLVLGVIASMLNVALAQTQGPGPENEHFQRVWARTDKPVLDGHAERSWIWGEDSLTGWFYENYLEAPEGRRLVQYFDKSRMEITRPEDDAESVWYVTNGLLVMELITGNLQVGDSEYQERQPAEVNVAGDADDTIGPTYATFAGLLETLPLDIGENITQRLARDGTVTDDPSLADRDIAAAQIDSVTNHAIAAPFWDFMNASGTVYEEGVSVEAALFDDPLFGTGRPVSEAYWSEVTVAGTIKDVLIQCFERRCLTYTPDNAPEWQVEMGNIGQHYVAWRYMSPEADALEGRVAYIEQEGEGSSIWIASPDRSDAERAVEPGGTIVALEWLPDGSGVVFLRAIDESTQEVVAVDVETGAELSLLSSAEDETLGTIDVSPDGSWVAIYRTVPNPDEPDGSELGFFGDIMLARVDGAETLEPLQPEVGRRFRTTWSPDGSWLALNHYRYWGRPAGGPGAISNFSGDIVMVAPSSGDTFEVTDDNGGVNNGEVAWAPDSTAIAYVTQYSPTSGINHDSDIFVAMTDGSDPVNLTSDLNDRNDDPNWTPDGMAITFTHDELTGEPVYGYAGDTLYSMDLETSELTELVVEDGLDELSDPAWSPTGEIILAGSFYSDRPLALVGEDIWWIVGDMVIWGREWSDDGEHILVAVAAGRSGDALQDRSTWVFNREGILTAVYPGDLVNNLGVDYLN